MANEEHIQVYEAADGFRWRWVAANGRTMADSGEAYEREAACALAASHVAQAQPPVRLEEENGNAVEPA